MLDRGWVVRRGVRRSDIFAADDLHDRCRNADGLLDYNAGERTILVEAGLGAVAARSARTVTSYSTGVDAGIRAAELEPARSAACPTCGRGAEEQHSPNVLAESRAAGGAAADHGRDGASASTEEGRSCTGCRRQPAAARRGGAQRDAVLHG